MFNIDYIKIGARTHQRLRKNLKVDYEYRFNQVLDPEFFGHHINVHAIVGKNGSGKSTLLEILFRLVNNLSFVLLKDIPREAADNLCYVFGLYAEMGWHEGEKTGVLTCEDTKVTFSCGHYNLDFTVDEKASVRIHWADYGFEKEYAEVRDMASNFFYTLVMNYSMQSYVAQDYLGEESKRKNSNRCVTWFLKNVWINALFHKNDGYMCPININPYRHEGTIDMNKEMNLTRSRVAALLQYFKYRGQHLIDGYQLDQVVYTYRPTIIKSYFDSDEILKRYNELIPPKDEKEEKDRQENKDENGRKVEWIRALFVEALKAEGDNVAKTVLSVFHIDPLAFDSESYQIAMLYLICKVLNIGHTYPKYLLYTNGKTSYQTIQVLDKQGDAGLLEVVRELAERVLKEHSHVTRKVHRAEIYLNQYGEIRRKSICGLENYEEENGLSAGAYLDAFDGRKEHEKSVQNIAGIYSLEELEYFTPPSIYEQHVYLKKENAQGVAEGEPIELSLLSSGERQFVFSMSSIIYHLTNLRSVEEGLPKYHCYNLVIDEVELCFHPEYQRTFLRDLLRLLERLEFNCGDQYVNVLLTTHSPFLLSDIPEGNILYMTDGEDLPIGRTFGANIYDLLNQQFFMKNTIGAFAAEKLGEVARVYRMEKNLQERERQFREGYDRMTALCSLIGDDYLRKMVMQMVGEMSRQYGMEEVLDAEEIERQIREHEEALRMLRRRQRND